MDLLHTSRTWDPPLATAPRRRRLRPDDDDWYARVRVCRMGGGWTICDDSSRAASTSLDEEEAPRTWDTDEGTTSYLVREGRCGRPWTNELGPRCCRRDRSGGRFGDGRYRIPLTVSDRSVAAPASGRHEVDANPAPLARPSPAAQLLSRALFRTSLFFGCGVRRRDPDAEKAKRGVQRGVGRGVEGAALVRASSSRLRAVLRAFIPVVPWCCGAKVPARLFDRHTQYNFPCIAPALAGRLGVREKEEEETPRSVFRANLFTLGSTSASQPQI